MTTFLLVWYACGWAGLAGHALYIGIVRWRDVVRSAVYGPFELIYNLRRMFTTFIWRTNFMDRPLWQKK